MVCCSFIPLNPLEVLLGWSLTDPPTSLRVFPEIIEIRAAQQHMFNGPGRACLHGRSLKGLALTYKDSFFGIICLLSWSELLPSSSAGLRGFGRSLRPLLSGEDF